jgi:hypothetical protein
VTNFFAHHATNNFVTTRGTFRRAKYEKPSCVYGSVAMGVDPVNNSGSVIGFAATIAKSKRATSVG